MLLGLTGQARSGKDAIYGFVEEWAQEQSISARREAFADRLKLSLARLFDPAIDQAAALDWAEAVKQDGTIILQLPDSEPVSIPGRVAFQRFGDEGHREVLGEDIWIEPVLARYHPLNSELLVVTDVRYANEAHEVRAMGGQLWRVLRPDLDQDPHRSERGIPDALIHRTINNDRDLHHLRRVVHSTLDHTVTLAGI